MPTSAAIAKRFDYLEKYDTALEDALGVTRLSKTIDHWRQEGMDFPEDAIRGTRALIEDSLRHLLGLPSDDMDNSLNVLIPIALKEGVIDKRLADKCHTARRIGNKGSHRFVGEVNEANKSLTLLDFYLRWHACNLGLIPEGEPSPTDPIFLVRTNEEKAKTKERARLASALSETKEIEKKAQKAVEAAAACDEEMSASINLMANLLQQAEALLEKPENKGNPQLEDMYEGLLVQLDGRAEELDEKREEVKAQLEEVDEEIDEILSEHDFIRKLLRGDNRATEKQLGVMAFPRGSGSVTNILQIAGGAGTGKTLCLLAKIISEADDHGQTSLFGELKSALFVCFNKGLAGYVRGILSNYEGKLPHIEVTHYDEFINQLVRKNPKQGYEHLAQYAKDVRYDKARIIYEFDDQFGDLLTQAQKRVAACYADKAKEYYLDHQDEEGRKWLCEELKWIEARFASDKEAHEKYPKAERIGRGAKRRPNEAIRKIILEVRRELNHLLLVKGFYTIEQATKRLLATDSLPKYDAIAIDEVQDFSLLSIKLLLEFRRSAKSKVFLSGDENQKIYQRDFTWKELDSDLKGHTITLSKNMRNSTAIRCFSDRLLGVESSHERSSGGVDVRCGEPSEVVAVLRKLASGGARETTALIGDKYRWSSILKRERVPFSDSKYGEICNPGIYLVGDLTGKGLEFDNVIVDYAKVASEDEECEKRLRYVHFSRARKRLLVFYGSKRPALLEKYYADFLAD